MSTAFVTVGTTSFDDLILETNKATFHAALRKLGYAKLIVQYGNGIVEPRSPTSESFYELIHSSRQFDSLSNLKPLPVDMFRFKPNLDEEFMASSLVISHGGAGTCLRALTPCGARRLIVVINDSLMGNHQEELGRTLAEGKHALVTTPTKLNALLCGDSLALTFPFEPESSNVSKLLEPSIPPREVGFIGFQRGNPERLVKYLEMRLKV